MAILLILLGIMVIGIAVRGIAKGRVGYKLWTCERDRRPILFWWQIGLYSFIGAVLLASGVQNKPLHRMLAPLALRQHRRADRGAQEKGGS